MRKVSLVLCLLLSVLLLGCSLNKEKITVESRSYTAAIGERISYEPWSKTQIEVEPNKVIYSNNKYNIEVTIVSVSNNNIRIKFSEPIFCTTTNRNGDIFSVQKNRTYAFCFGSVEGVEVKLRFI